MSSAATSSTPTPTAPGRWPLVGHAHRLAAHGTRMRRSTPAYKVRRCVRQQLLTPLWRVRQDLVIPEAPPCTAPAAQQGCLAPPLSAIRGEPVPNVASEKGTCVTGVRVGSGRCVCHPAGTTRTHGSQYTPDRRPRSGRSSKNRTHLACHVREGCCPPVDRPLCGLRPSSAHLEGDVSCQSSGLTVRAVEPPGTAAA
jgi:hypothetical protein